MTRPTRFRRGARVIVLSGDEVLLLGDSDPGVPGFRWWVAPGGGVDPGEEERVAAARELHEETGLRLAPEALGEPAARRRVVHGYTDRVLVQDEVFYVVRVPRFEVSSSGLTERELDRSHGCGWFPVTALPDDVWAANIPDLAAWAGGAPLAIGVVEESSVPAPEVLAEVRGFSDSPDQ